jgi:hypothetical protein
LFLIIAAPSYHFLIAIAKRRYRSRESTEPAWWKPPETQKTIRTVCEQAATEVKEGQSKSPTSHRIPPGKPVMPLNENKAR